jgi:hypothetical protein
MTNHINHKPKKQDIEIANVLQMLACGLSYQKIIKDVHGWSGAEIYKAKSWFLNLDDIGAQNYISSQDHKDEIIQWRNVQLKIQAEREQTKNLTKAHLEEGIDECRWCFAVDFQRIVGKEIARYNFPDGTLWHFSCPRCGGEFSLYSAGYEKQYLLGMINKLHPELKGEVSDELFDLVNNRVLYDFNLEEYLDC